MALVQKEIILPGNPPFFQNPKAEKLIVFIHGLTGDPIKTWSSDDDSPFFWPQELAKDPAFQNTDVLSFGYTSDIGAPLNIPQLAQHLETTLAELNRFIPYESISFVAHSLGGLVTRQFILNHFQEIKIGTVVLLSTPNFGHRMSRMAKFISANAHLEQLDPAQGKYIDGLNDQWRKEFREKRGQEPFRIAAGYEMFPLYRTSGKVGIIVEKYAAINFASHTQGFEADHIQIVKPGKESDPQFIWVRQQLLELPRDERNREYTEAEEKRFEEIIDDLQKALAGTDLEEALNLISQGKLDEALTLLSKNEAKEDEQVLKIAKARFAKAQVYELKFDYKNALKFYEKAIQLLPENSECLHAFHYLKATGSVSHTLGKFDQAILYCQKALVIGLKIFKEDDTRLSNVGNNLGEAWRKKGNYKMAILYFNKALEIDLKHFGPDHPNIATYHNNMGAILMANGDYDKALKSFENALAIDLNHLGLDHHIVAYYWNNIGEILRMKGEYDKAIGYFEKALASDMKNYGLDFPNYATYCGNLGAVWSDKKEYAKALDYFKKALASMLKYFGSDHPDVAICWNNMGTVCANKGDQDQALGYYEKALESAINTLGPEHPQVAIYWNNLGVAWRAKGQYDKAIGYHEKALASDLKNFSSDHPKIKIAEKNLKKVRKEKDGQK